MPRIREIAFLICVILCLKVKTFQKELGLNHDSNVESDEWTQMKWDSILKDPSSVEKSNLSIDDPDNFDPLLSFNNGQDKDKVKLSENELQNFPEDEVSVAKLENIHENTKKSDKDVPRKQANGETSLDLAEDFSFKDPSNDVDLNSDDKLGQNMESIIAPESSELNNSQLLISSRGGESHIGHTETDFLKTRSFIFNPTAKAEEQFQNCTTPTNETGHCRYLQHCMIPSLISSLSKFMDYVCIIEGRFIGVCCPTFPVSLVVVQKQENLTSEESNLDGECGIATNTRIVGGGNADPKAWPWMVALLTKTSKRFFCGGALINDRYVLTAAHCTFGVSNNEITARVGEYDFKDDGESHDDFAVVEMKRHGHYNRRTLQNDIALLKLEKPVVSNEFVKTICFPEEEQSYVGEIATLAGWGNIKGGGKTSEVLQEASFPVISNEECSKGHGLPIAESLICTAAAAKDKGACNGDSGGPLMLLDENDRWKVIGLVSWGRRGCNPEFPTAYTRVSHYLDWIREHSK